MCIIYHNPHCSKSRNAIAILEKSTVNFTIINYLDNPPTKNELIEILQALKMSAKDFIRSGETIFKTLKLENADEERLINAMIENPILIERPIIKTKKGIVIGRPPENVLTVL